jgi:[glutamine synthetase] adenylyltransferase / [glutamine synthetase]-adenylyl-L-tyrosine phosphorylase
LSLLRQHYRHRIFTAGARDLVEERDVYESMGANSAAAEDAIAAAFGMVGDPTGLCVMALGRLGSSEFDLLSDADLLFVSEEQADPERFAKVGGQLVQALAAYTRDGMVFPVDTRLRPRGGAGDLVVTPSQMLTYFEQEAHPWEALTFTKLRFLVGSRSLGERALAVSNVLFHRFAADPGFLPAMQAMRSRLEATDPPGPSFKTSAGAIYDIDFLSGYLLIQDGVNEKQGTMRDRLWRCAAAGLLDKSDAAVLDHAAELLRTVEHVVRLVVGRAHKWLPTTEYARRVSEKLAARILRRDFPDGLEAELLRTCRDVREIYERVLRAS